MSTVYGPCHEPDRTNFVNWLLYHDVQDHGNWLFFGDFNFYRSLANRNKLGGNLSDTLVFNDLLGHLGFIELPLKVGPLLGPLCSKTHFWSNWIGFHFS
jgi:hypothetical protein